MPLVGSSLSDSSFACICKFRKKYEPVTVMTISSSRNFIWNPSVSKINDIYNQSNLSNSIHMDAGSH
ncbi:unnamed protein product [Caenorhabditis nigoni]